MFYISIAIAKLASKLITLLGLGAGYTWPGYLVRLINPNILLEFNRRYRIKYILISGTNGKTTTAKLVSHILHKEGYAVMHNKSGANLANGIVSALILETHLLKKDVPDYCVLEVDEMTLPSLLKEIEPSVIVLLNLSRDQLDRYGETEIILEKWLQSIKPLRKANLVIDSTQSYFDVFREYYAGPVFYFDADTEALHHTSLLGDYNAKNVNAAVLTAGICGVGKERCLRDLADFAEAYGRGETIDYNGNLYRIFLAKNPVSLNNNLELLLSGDVPFEGVLFLLNDEVRDGRDVSWIYDVSPDLLYKTCFDKHVFVGGDRCLDFAIRLQYAGIKFSSNDVTANLPELFQKIRNTSNCKNVAVLPNYSAMLAVRKHLTGKEIL